MLSVKIYILKKGPADMFRGDWYTGDEVFATPEEAIMKAARLTLLNYAEWKNKWEEFGYEWSVFEKENEAEKKIWEGFKYIQSSKDPGNATGGINAGLL